MRNRYEALPKWELKPTNRRPRFNSIEITKLSPTINSSGTLIHRLNGFLRSTSIVNVTVYFMYTWPKSKVFSVSMRSEMNYMERSVLLPPSKYRFRIKHIINFIEYTRTRSHTKPCEIGERRKTKRKNAKNKRQRQNYILLWVRNVRRHVVYDKCML